MDIESSDVFRELSKLFESNFKELVVALGYKEKKLLHTDEDEFIKMDERQNAIATAVRRTRNRKIIGAVFESPQYIEDTKVLKKLLSGYDQFFIIYYLEKNDWYLSKELVEQAITDIFNAQPNFEYWIGLKIRSIIPKEVHWFNSTWYLSSVTPEMFLGMNDRVDWIQRALQTKWIPSQFELNQANGFLLCKTNSNLNLSEADSNLQIENLILQLSPAVVRSTEVFGIRENNLIQGLDVFPIPSNLPTWRFRIPLPNNDITEFINDIDWLLKHSKYISTHPKGRSALERYVLAINFYCSNNEGSFGYDDAVHDAVIGLETLMVGAQTEVSYRFQTIIYRLMPEKKDQAIKVLKRLYGLRSTVAHEGRTSGKKVTTHVDAFQAISLLNASIRWYLKMAEKMSEKEIKEYLESLPFSNQKDIAKSPWGTVTEIAEHPPQNNGPWKT
jgi:hypothetical protein